MYNNYSKYSITLHYISKFSLWK